jgi:hypothetical protein
MAGKWTSARRRAAAARLKAHAADLVAVRWTDARREAHSAAIRAAHAEGRYPRQRAYWPTVAEAGERLDAMLHRSVDVGHGLQRGFHGLGNIEVTRPIHPLECLWRDHDAIETTTDTDVDDTLRMAASSYRPTGAVSADWSSIHAHRRAAELAALVRAQQADAMGATA